MVETQEYKFKTRRIEDKKTNTEKIEGQHLYVLNAEEATEGIPKMRLVSDKPFNLKAGAHIVVTIQYDKVATELEEKNLTVAKDQQRLDETLNPVTGMKSSKDDPIKKGMAELKETAIKKLAEKANLAPGERKAVKLAPKKR